MTAAAPFELSIIVPCYNEEANLPELVQRVRAALAVRPYRAEILLVDDKSQDNTRSVIEELARGCVDVRGLYHDWNQGISTGWRTGVAASRAPYVLITDADLQYAPEDIPRLLETLRERDLDIVQGWRSVRKDASWVRSFLSEGFGFLLARLSRTCLKDMKSGFLCARREVFEEVLRTRYRYRFFQHFVVVAAVAKGFRIGQIPIVFWPRRAGRSFIASPVFFALESLLDLPRAFWEFRVLGKRSS